MLEVRHHVFNQNFKALVSWVFSIYKLFYFSPHIQCEILHLNKPTSRYQSRQEYVTIHTSEYNNSIPIIPLGCVGYVDRTTF
ncbi:hypothetical protein Lalb_Chr11g0073371 [Lupinus albus]|uniref:Uncharacterized protein n=1 Tax=Lupinus albus TaxID=3870 RepID=A0A6A4PTI9_LUPAL|nr:hypothetical protein Lalb_Chr11g0073371 [Lupinus albus]